jgi:cullin-associated NEDD8-dissociated protein 1
LITDTPEEMGPVIVGILPRQLLEGLNRNLSEGVKRECLDILTDLLKRFGALCSKQHNDILTTVLKQLQDKKPAVQKRASTCLVAFSVVCSDSLFDTLVETILSRVDSSKEDVPSLIQTIGIISRTVGYRMGRYLNRLVPMFIRFCGSSSVEDYDEDEDQKLNELR